MSAGLWEVSMTAPEFRKNECCFSCHEGAKQLCDGGYIHWEKRNPAPGIYKALGERKRRKTRWAQELWDYRAVPCLQGPRLESQRSSQPRVVMSCECGTGCQTGHGDNREVSSPCGKILMLWYVSDTLSGGAQGAGSPLKEEEAEPGCQNAWRGESPLKRTWCDMVSSEKQSQAGKWLQHQGEDPFAQARCCGQPWHGQACKS